MAKAAHGFIPGIVCASLATVLSILVKNDQIQVRKKYKKNDTHLYVCITCTTCKVLPWVRSRDKFGVSASTACEKVNTAGADENLFRLVPGHGARVVPLELVPMPAGQGVQIFVRAPTKGYVQTGARARAGHQV